MTLRHSLHPVLLSVVGLSASVVAPQAFANTGTITFQGETTAATCIVEGGTSNLPNFTVELPSVSTDVLTPGDIAGRTRFSMRLRNCTGVVGGVRAHFEAGPTVDAASGTLLPSNGGSVHFALFDENGTAIDVGTNHPGGPAYAADSTMYYEVAYQRVGATAIAPGQFTGSVAYTLQYD